MNRASRAVQPLLHAKGQKALHRITTRRIATATRPYTINDLNIMMKETIATQKNLSQADLNTLTKPHMQKSFLQGLFSQQKPQIAPIKSQSTAELAADYQKFINALPKALQESFRNPIRSLPQHALRGITVMQADEQMQVIRQQQRDFSVTSPEFQKYHDAILTKKLPFNHTADIEFTNKPNLAWDNDSFIGFLLDIIKAPWDALKYVWFLGVKVYLRFTKQYDNILTPWVYQLLDLDVPYEDLVFDMHDFTENEHQLYTLITHVLRYQLVIELALKQSIQECPYPEQFVEQQQRKAKEMGMSEEDFKKQIDLSRQAFFKQKIRALKSLQLVGVPDVFEPDNEVMDMIQKFEFPEDFPIEQVIAQPELGVELIKRLILEQLVQVPMPQLQSLLEFKGLSSAVRSLQRPEHFGEYQRLLQVAMSPDMSIRRTLRQLSVADTSKDYEQVKVGVMRSLQHIRRVIKTYQRQQQQIKDFGFIVKRKKNINPQRLSRSDRDILVKDLETGRFASIDDMDPEEIEEGGSLIEDEFPLERTRQNTLPSSTKTKSKKIENHNLTDEEAMMVLRLLHADGIRDQEGTPPEEFEITEELLLDNSNDEEIMAQALDAYENNVVEMKKDLKKYYIDITDGRGFFDEYAEDDEPPAKKKDPAEGLDELNDGEGDEQYLSEHLVPSKRNQTGKDKRGRDLPVHIEPDPNPKVVTKKMYNEAIKFFPTFQQRLRTIDRLMLERDFHLKDKYLFASHYFERALLDEKQERSYNNDQVKNLMKHIKSLYSMLPEEVRVEFEKKKDETLLKAIEEREKRRAQIKELREKQRAEQEKVKAATQQAAKANNGDVNAIKQAQLETALQASDHPVDSLHESPDLSILHNEAPTAITASIDASSTPTDAPVAAKPAIPKLTELEEVNFMLNCIQQYQVATYRDRFAEEELKRLHQKKELELLSQNRDLLSNDEVVNEMKKIDSLLQDPTMTPEQVEQMYNGENVDEQTKRIFALRQSLDNIEVKLPKRTQQAIMEKALQQAELPLQQQLRLQRFAKTSNTELFNSEMVDIMYNSMQSLLQTSLYDSSQHNVVENSVGSLILSLLSQEKQIESYDDMVRFNESIEEILNKPRVTVNKMSSVNRKFLLMACQQEYNLNQAYPVGYIPYMPFLDSHKHQFDSGVKNLSSATKSNTLIDKQINKLNNPYLDNSTSIEEKAPETPQEAFIQHDYMIRRLPQTRKLLTDKILKEFASIGGRNTKIRQQVASTAIPLSTTDVQLHEDKGNYFISERFDRLIISPEDLVKDPFDAKFDIISQKHLLQQLKRVRDRRLRELLQVIYMISSDEQSLQGTTKFHIKQLTPAFQITGLPEALVAHLTHYYTHRSIASTLQSIIQVLSTMRKEVVDKMADFSLTEYDLALQYTMDLYQYHLIQLQHKMPDFYNTQFKALDISQKGFKNYNKPWRSEWSKPLSIKQLNSLAADAEYDV